MMNLDQCMAVGTVLSALNQSTEYVDRGAPTESQLRAALEVLAAGASKRMQLTYLPNGARKPLKLKVAS